MYCQKKSYKSFGSLATVLTTCLAVGSYSNVATAIDVYKNNGLTYKLKADWQIQLNKDVGKDQNINLEFDDLELKNTVIYDLNDHLKAFGQLDFSFDNAANAEEATGNTRLEEAFLGFIYGNTKVSFGKTNTAGDEFGIEKAYEKVGIPEDGFEEIADKGDDLIRVDYKSGNFYLASSLEIEGEGEGSADDPSLFDIFGSVKFSGIKLAAAYMDYQPGPSEASIKVQGVSASYGPVAVDYSQINNPGSTADVDIANIAASFSLAPTTSWAIGFNEIDSDADADDARGWYSNITYKFPSQKKVSIFAEIGDNNKTDVSMGYLVGLRIKI